MRVMLFPTVGIATIQVLEQLGHAVDFPGFRPVVDKYITTRAKGRRRFIAQSTGCSWRGPSFARISYSSPGKNIDAYSFATVVTLLVSSCIKLNKGVTVQ